MRRFEPVLVVSLVVLGGLALLVRSSDARVATRATEQRAVANSTTFEDAIGEDPAGPDITSVVVSNDDAGVLTFRVAIPSHPVLTEDMRITIWIGLDDAAAGRESDGPGVDHLMLEVDEGHIGFGVAELVVYKGSTGVHVGASVGVQFSYEDGVALFSFDAAARDRLGGPLVLGRAFGPPPVGSVKRFRFMVRVMSGIQYDPVTRTWDFTNAHSDFAPAVVEQVSPPDRYWVYEWRGPLRLESFSAKPATPRAGRPFTLSLAAARTDTGAPLANGTVSCSFKLAGRALRPRSSGFARQRAVCVFAIPTNARGRRFRTAISLQSRGTKLTRSLSGRVA